MAGRCCSKGRFASLLSVSVVAQLGRNSWFFPVPLRAFLLASLADLSVLNPTLHTYDQRAFFSNCFRCLKRLN